MKSLSKILSVMLAAVILCVSLSVAGEARSAAVCPRIYIHGFMANHILSDKDDENSPSIFPPNSEDIFGTIKSALPALSTSLIKGGIDGFSDEACKVANEIMSQAYLDKNGEVTDKSGVYFKYPEASAISKNSKLDFSYDWRLDPIDIAAQLNDFINYVLECSGAEKVNLSGHSCGGVIIVTYAAIYGTEKIQGVCFNAAAVFGESYNGDLMTGKMTFNGKAFDYFLKYIVDTTDFQYLITAIIDAASAAGIFDLTATAANALLGKINDKLSTQVMMPMFCHWLTIWAMVPDEAIEASMEFVFDNMLKDEDSSVLRSKIERFNTLVRSRKKETLIKLNETSHMYVLSRYGYPSIPITPSYDVMGDGIVDTKYSSFGATTAAFGTTFPEDYLAQADPRYISPDKTVDASTCMFPDRTWFIRSYKHALVTDAITEFSDFLLEQAEQVTVDTFEEYPGFLVYDAENDLILPDTNYRKPTVFDRLKKMVEEIIKLIVMVFKIKTA